MTLPSRTPLYFACQPARTARARGAIGMRAWARPARAARAVGSVTLPHLMRLARGLCAPSAPNIRQKKSIRCIGPVC
jgi:hypothetical protein